MANTTPWVSSPSASVRHPGTPWRNKDHQQWMIRRKEKWLQGRAIISTLRNSTEMKSHWHLFTSHTHTHIMTHTSKEVHTREHKDRFLFRNNRLLRLSKNRDVSLKVSLGLNRGVATPAPATCFPQCILVLTTRYNKESQQSAEGQEDRPETLDQP